MNPRISIRLLLSIVVIICFTSLSACNTPSPTDEVMSLAMELIEQGEYTAAESHYRDLLDTDENPEPALALADLYTTWQRPSLGLNALDTAFARGISPAEVITRQLALLMMDKQWAQVVDSAQTHLIGDPGNPAVLQALTTAHLHLNNCEKARVMAERAWLADGDYASAALNHSILNEDTEVLCSVNPDICATIVGCDRFCRADIGIELIKLNNWALAGCVLEGAVDDDPNNAAAHSWLGESLARIGQVQAAQDHFYIAVDLDSSNPLGWLLLGSHALKTGDLETARAALLNAQRLDPENPAPCLTIAELKAALGLYNEVDTWIKAALERAVNNIDIWKAAVQVYLARNLVHSEMPTRIADSAVHLDRQDAEAHLLLGWAYFLQGDTGIALPQIDRAIELDPSLGHAHYLRGLLLQYSGNTEQANIAFIRAADLGYFP